MFLKQHKPYVIGDDSVYLYEYDYIEHVLNKIKILNSFETFDNIPKAIKPDFEVLCNFHNSLYILASGSTLQRNLMVEYNLETKAIIQHDISQLYTKIKNKCNIDDDNLNIEGVICNGEYWLLFNRGNGADQKNGIIKIIGNNLVIADKIEFTPLILSKENENIVSFTDAIFQNNEIYFLAAAEDTNSTYQDGEILGSYLGRLNLITFELNYIKQISTNQKFEAITFYKQNGKDIEFLLCEDRDNEILETLIYKLIL